MKKAYQKYKATNIPWLTEMPEGWKTVRFKYLFQEINDRSETGQEELLSVSQYTGVTFRKDRIENERDNLTNANSLEGYKIVAKGDLVINIMLAWNGSLGISPYEGLVSPAYCVYRGNGKVLPKYFHYLLRTDYYKGDFKKVSSGVIESRLRMYSDDFFSLYTVLPPLPEQRQIAAFLDHKCALIDTFIQKKTRIIELLKEQKQAIINRAVTRGIDPNVRLKPSGIEWLGEVPEGWEVKRLKHVAKVQSGIALNEKSTNLPGLEEVPYLRVANVQDGYIDLKQIKTIKLPKENLKRYSINKGNLLMNEGGDFDKLGRGVVWEGQLEPCVHQNHVFVVKVVKKYNPYWINLLTQTDYGKAYFISKAKQTTNLASISSSNLKDFPIINPPLNESKKILEYLEKESKLFDEALARVEKELSLMIEYKTTLIAEAVTGKIDVRGWSQSAEKRTFEQANP